MDAKTKKAVEKIKAEIHRYVKTAGTESRWRFGYIDGLTQALKYITEEEE